VSRLPGQHGIDERGSALLLVPAGILIVIILAAITVDASLAFMAERSAASIASAAANDAASLAIDIDHFRETGEYKIDPNIAETAEVVAASARIQAGNMFIPGTLQVQVRVIDPTQVEVIVSGQVDRFILPSFASGPQHISARAIGTIDVTP